MKKISSLILFCFLCSYATANQITGTWKVAPADLDKLVEFTLNRSDAGGRDKVTEDVIIQLKELYSEQITRITKDESNFIWTVFNGKKKASREVILNPIGENEFVSAPQQRGVMSSYKIRLIDETKLEVTIDQITLIYLRTNDSNETLKANKAG